MVTATKFILTVYENLTLAIIRANRLVEYAKQKTIDNGQRVTTTEKSA